MIETMVAYQSNRDTVVVLGIFITKCSKPFVKIVVAEISEHHGNLRVDRTYKYRASSKLSMNEVLREFNKDYPYVRDTNLDKISKEVNSN
jgi:hypothetical protein